MALCCKCWLAGVPPTWLVVCAVVLVQVFKAFLRPCKTAGMVCVGGVGFLPCDSEEVLQRCQPPHIQLLSGPGLLPSALPMCPHSREEAAAPWTQDDAGM